MTNITVLKKDDKIMQITAKNHSNYSEFGKDIVCAGVSALMQTLIVSLKNLTKCKFEYCIDESKVLIDVKLLQSDCEAQIILESVLLGLKGIQENYKKFINIKEKVYE